MDIAPVGVAVVAVKTLGRAAVAELFSGSFAAVCLVGSVGSAMVLPGAWSELLLAKVLYVAMFSHKELQTRYAGLL